MQYVVIDFEATCDEPYNPTPQEIIEFPAILVDSEQDDEAVEFHAHVRPVAHPRLTDFCRELTGIRQEQVDRAASFPEVLAQFGSWLRTHCDGDTLFVTCGDWDLASMLPRQCTQHRLAVPAWANRWANLKRIFAWHFPQASGRVGLVGMASSLDLPLVGRLHSGIDDARNIAQVLRRLLEMGVGIDNTAFWRCLGCGVENDPRARECRRCGRASVSPRAGDWACAKCGCGNFAHRDRCFDCGMQRAVGSDPAPPPVLKPGDWLCARCCRHNFARRNDCFQCGGPRRSHHG
jgi:inhibitor of KinA sporulation pathway (predicted exonuclease)